MAFTFTDQLLRFTKSVDTMDRATFEQCLAAVATYLRSVEATYFAVYIDGVRVNRLPGLEHVWGSTEDYGHYSIYASIEPKTYSGLVGYCYDLGRPVWITSGDGERALSGQKPPYHDEWNDERVTVPYVGAGGCGNDQAATTVLLPLQLGKRVFGVLNLDFDRVLHLTSARREELTELDEAVSTIFWLHETTEQNATNTKVAFERFRATFHLANSALGNSTVFFASPFNADPRVAEVIRATLRSFPSVTVVDWQDMRAPGTITEQIEEAIRHASFGVCYLSERDSAAPPGAGLRFRDNPNVLFEAGMLHSARRQLSGEAGLWIAVREAEKLSSEVPFDLAGLRLIDVPRMPDGNLDEAGLGKELAGMVRWILDNL